MTQVDINRNAPCSCGSGKRFKECCGRHAGDSSASFSGSSAHLMQEQNLPQAIMTKLAELLQMGQHEALEKQATLLLKQYPNAGFLWQVLSIALSSQGKEALPAFQRAALLLPHNINAQINLGIALLSIDQITQAGDCFKRALMINPDSTTALIQMVLVLLKLDKIEEALKCCQRVVELEPNSPEMLKKLGDVFSEYGLLQEAILMQQRAVALKPDLYDSHVSLGNVFLASAKPDEALHAYQRALKIRPESVEAVCHVATTLRLKGHTAEAEAMCRQSLKSEPDSANILAVLGEVLADSGKFSEAEDVFKKALLLDRGLLEAWYGMVYLRKQSLDDTETWLEAEQLANTPMQPGQELLLRYAVAKFYDDTARYDRAFSNYHKANELSKSLRPSHDRGALTRSTEEIIRHYDATWLTKHRRKENQDIRPVFIVGMMRSGTSLAEQILASHPAVHGAGEMGFWGTEFLQFESGRNRGDSIDSMVTGLGTRHAEMLDGMSKNALRVLDKTPINFLYLGLINIVFPNARIIHMQRDPVDTCVSIYFQNFQRAITYANDLGDLAHCYGEYRRLIAHWRAALPADNLLEVQYEALIEDQEYWTRKMLEFIDLPWDERCMDFHKTDRTVLTASKWQVRQKINRNSVERWRNYEQFLGPLLTLLD